MKITTHRLHHLIKSILSEGQSEDLVQKFPELSQAYDTGVKKITSLQWLLRMKYFEPITDMIGLVLEFEKQKNRLPIKDLTGYAKPGDLRIALEELGQSKSSQIKSLKADETTVVYEDEEFKVVMPHTMESSIQWGKGTTWCTAATQSENLFYSYTLYNKDSDIMLYYIIRKGADSKADPNAKLSVGFIDGDLILDGEEGGLSVNAANTGLTEYSLREILYEKFDEIIDKMTIHAGSQLHPAKKKIKRYIEGNDLLDFDRTIMNLDGDDKINYVLEILNSPHVNRETISHIAKNVDKRVRAIVAGMASTPLDVLIRLANDKDSYVLISVASNINCDERILLELSKSKNEYILSLIAAHKKTPIEILARLSKMKNSHIDMSLAINPNSPVDTLVRIFEEYKDNRGRYNSQWISGIASNESTPVSILIKLSEYSNSFVDEGLSLNKSVPIDILNRLAESNDEDIRNNAIRTIREKQKTFDL